MNQSVSIYLSTPHEGKSYKNLGGPPTIPLQDDMYVAHIFEIESLHGGEVFAVLYARNDSFSVTQTNSSAAIAVGIDYTSNADIVDEEYLRSVNLTIYRPTYITKNYTHPPITPLGQFVNEPQNNVKDFIPDLDLNRKVLFIDEILEPGEYIPFLLRLTIKQPIPTVFSQKIIFNIFSGVF